MSFLSDFEGRISSVFESAPQGYAEPFSFKKLAKHAARKMESETYRIDGVDTAPALYTVLVSAEDDSLMRPLYERIDYELGEFITESANKKGYALVGRPLVRFMVDESLKSGKFYVDAENVNEQTLARLREEERAFLGGNSSMGGAAAMGRPRRSSAGHLNPIPQPVAPAPAPAPQAAPSGTDAGLDVMLMDYVEPAGGVIPAVASPSSSTPMPVPYVDASPSQVVAPVAVPVATPAAGVQPVVQPVSPALQQRAQAVMEATPQPANFPTRLPRSSRQHTRRLAPCPTRADAATPPRTQPHPSRPQRVPQPACSSTARAVVPTPPKRLRASLAASARSAASTCAIPTSRAATPSSPMTGATGTSWTSTPPTARSSTTSTWTSASFATATSSPLAS